MDKLTLSNPVVIVVIGLPGAGKSFFATQFATSLDVALVSEDKIRWTLFAHHTYNENENAIVKQVANMMVAELFKTKETFILDGGHNDRASRAILTTQAKKAGYDVFTVIVQTDTPTAKQRSTKRHAKKASNLYTQPIDGNTFETQCKKYQAPLRIERTTIVISGKHTYSTQARIVLKKILGTQGDTLPAEQHPTPAVRPYGPLVQ
ncbi:MAG: ATP-binding protein [Candidatus Nomurabacteria bacterium]|jgi:predicted kinase|nr:ATP-binding protein [Candidatus Nomurabacteria bacterium]